MSICVVLLLLFDAYFNYSLHHCLFASRHTLFPDFTLFRFTFSNFSSSLLHLLISPIFSIALGLVELSRSDQPRGAL
jgi:hypothetical protein